MTCLQALILGILQGAAEVLPLSAPAHLAVLHCFFGLPAPGDRPLFALLLRAGTLLGLCLACRRELGALLRGFFGLFDGSAPVRRAGRADRRLGLLLIMATLPLFLTLPFRNRLSRLTESPMALGGLMLLGGVGLFLAGRIRGGSKDRRSASLGDAMLVGLGQALGMVPGLGRGLGAVCTGLWRRLDGPFAAELSLLLAVPALLGSGVLYLAETIRYGADTGLGLQYLIGTAAAALAAFAAAEGFRLLARRGRLGDVSYYCWGLGLVTLCLGMIA